MKETTGKFLPMSSKPKQYFDMALLDDFAAKAMQALITNPTDFEDVKDDVTCAKRAYSIAATMLEERKKYLNQ